MEVGCKSMQHNPQVIKLLRCRCNFAILKRGEKNGRTDEAVPAADSSWVLLPRQRHPPWRVTPWCFYHCLLSSKFNPYFFTQPSFPLDATEAKGWNMVYSIRAIKHGWTGCNLSQTKKSKHPPQTPSINCQGLAIWEVSLFACIYIFNPFLNHWQVLLKTAA